MTTTTPTTAEELFALDPAGARRAELDPTRRDPSRPDPVATALASAEASCPPASTTPPAGQVCAWCEGPIPARARRDAVCCSVRCRQARHRFTRAAGRAVEGTSPVAGGRPRRLAYADPPYPGKAFYYRDHPDYAGEVDHAELIRRLCSYDGWALSTSAAALPAVLALCPPGVRVAAWHRGERPTRSWQPLNAWEPVIYLPARPLEASRATGGTRRVDSLVHGVTPMTTLPGRVVGAKPAAFCRWLFDLLAALPGDSLDDLFPGSGAVARAWRAYTATTTAAPATTDPAGEASGSARRAASPEAPADGSPGSAPDASSGPDPDTSNPTAAGHDTSGVDARRLHPAPGPAEPLVGLARTA